MGSFWNEQPRGTTFMLSDRIKELEAENERLRAKVKLYEKQLFKVDAKEVK